MEELKQRVAEAERAFEERRNAGTSVAVAAELERKTLLESRASRLSAVFGGMLVHMSLVHSRNLKEA